MDPEELEPKVTASFQLAPVASTNEFHSTTEDTAIQKIETDTMRRNYVNKIIKAVNRLRFHERNAIINRYFKHDDVFDYEVYNELRFGESKYYMIKSDAFYKLAFMLRIIVYKEVNDE